MELFFSDREGKMAMRERLLWVAGLVIWFLLRWLLPFLPIPPPLALWVGGVLFAVVVGGLVGLAGMAGRLWTPRHSLLGLFLASLFWVTLWLLRPKPESLFWGYFFGALWDTTVLTTSLFLGIVISPLIRHANLLPPIAAVAIVMDIWTVLLRGFVYRVAEKAPQVIEAASVKVPIVGAGALAELTGLTVPAIGLGDFLFTGFFFALLWRFRLNAFASLIWAVVLVPLGLALAQLPLFPLGLPGLPFLAAAVLLPNWRSFHYTPKERRALFVGALFFALLLTLFTALAHRFP